MASMFLFAPLAPPFNQSNKLALLVLNDRTKAHIQSIRQSLILHDAISTSIEFDGVFIEATEALCTEPDNMIEELIAWFQEHSMPIESGVLTIFTNGITVSGAPIGQASPEILSSEIIPYTFLEKEDRIVSLLPSSNLLKFSDRCLHADTMLQ